MVRQSHMNLAGEEGAHRQHHRARHEAQAGPRHDTTNLLAIDDQVIHFLLEQLQVRLILERLPNRRAIQHAIRLRPRRPHRRAFRRIQNPELDAGAIRRLRHDTTERIDLANQMPLADAPDRRVARHLPQRLDVLRQQQGPRAAARSRECGLGTGMAATDHDHIKLVVLRHAATRENAVIARILRG